MGYSGKAIILLSEADQEHYRKGRRATYANRPLTAEQTAALAAYEAAYYQVVISPQLVTKVPRAKGMMDSLPPDQAILCRSGKKKEKWERTEEEWAAIRAYHTLVSMRHGPRRHRRKARTIEEWKQINSTYNQSPKRKRDAKNRQLMKDFGISLEDYEHMLSLQGGRCDICGVEENPDGRRFHVDHDHTTGKVRGLLCGPCNSGIGLLKEDLAILTAAIKYLDKHQEW